MQSVKGKSILGGISIGTLRIYHKQDVLASKISLRTPSEESDRFQFARLQAKEQLKALYSKAIAEVGEAEAAIFEIHQMMLEDEDYIDAVESLIQDQRATAEYAALTGGSRMAAMFSAMDDAYMQARAADIEDVSARIAVLLAGQNASVPQAGGPFIIAADDLTPSETMQLDKSKLLGFVTRHGSANSHTAILARAMNVPALIGVDFDESWDGHLAVLDGYSQMLYVDPDAALLDQMQKIQRHDKEHADELRALRGEPTVTLDGHKILLYANIGSEEEAKSAVFNGAEGIGLFRSEFLYLEANDYPTEEQQFAAYKSVVQEMQGNRVIIRTLDIGADKQADYFHIAKEANPAMGYRAIRICLTQRDVFKRQLRAILRSSAFGKVAIMFPMIISVQEVRDARAILEECKAELIAKNIAVGEIEVGIMIETPAAVMIADELAQEVDFFSIGTNDLTQYTLAIDRQNPMVEALCNTHHPAILRMIRMTVDAAHRHHCWVGLCGELGADESLTADFLRMGLDELSVAPSAVLSLRKTVRSINLS